jgi:hypothetical protein
VAFYECLPVHLRRDDVSTNAFPLAQLKSVIPQQDVGALPHQLKPRAHLRSHSLVLEILNNLQVTRTHGEPRSPSGRFFLAS